jgi:hypothetical protein
MNDHEERIKALEEKVKYLERMQQNSWGTLPTDYYKGCRVCGIGKDGGVVGYVCYRSDCPTRITVGGIQNV